MKIIFNGLLTLSFFFSFLSFAQEATLSESADLHYKGLKRSMLKFDKVNVNKFLSLEEWKNTQKEKDLFPDWESIVRERNLKELAGHFFQCVGSCRVDRGEAFFRPQFRSNLYEGDEIQTFDESYAWIFLNEGTSLRLAPNSSITINEINIGIKENFINVRVNYGSITWLSRIENKLVEKNEKETDQLFFPLKVYDANPENSNEFSDDLNIEEIFKESNSTLKQYQKFNKILDENNKITDGKKTFAFIVLPNITLEGYSPSLEIVKEFQGKAYIKLKEKSDLAIEEDIDSSMKYQLRGYENSSFSELKSGEWYEVDEKGRKLEEATNIAEKVVGEFITSRIPSILIARELFFKDYSEVFFNKEYNREKLARLNGYRLWGKLDSDDNIQDDLKRRLEFLNEYFRRVETTNLMTADRFNAIIEERNWVLGDQIKSPKYFQKALDQYYNQEENHYIFDSTELNSTKKKLWKEMHGIK